MQIKMVRVLKFARIACDNVYLPLLLRLANDIEENPGPTVYGVVDPSKLFVLILAKRMADYSNIMLPSNVLPCH